MEINDNTIVITKDDGTSESWKIYFYYHNDERKKDFYFIYKEEDPDNLVVMSLSQSFLGRYQGIKGKLVSRSILYLFLFPAVSEGGGIHLLALLYSLIFLPFSLGFGLISFFGFLTLPPASLLMGYAKLLVVIINFLSKIDLVIPLGFMGDLLVFSYYLLLGLALYFWDSGLTFMRSKALFAMALAVSLNAMPKPL